MSKREKDLPAISHEPVEADPQKEYLELAEPPKEKKKKRLLRDVIIALCTLIGLVAILGAAGYLYASHLLGFMGRESIADDDSNLGIGSQNQSGGSSSKVSSESGSTSSGTSSESASSSQEEVDLSTLPYYFDGVQGITNIAMFGIDADEGTSGRSDTIMILTIDSNTKKIKLSSVVRDSYVDIPGHGMDKINHAYAFGGAQLALKTLNTNFHLNLKRYITVNFTSLPQIIDKIGGVEITVSEKEYPYVPGLTAAGKYLLTGDQALQFSRIRHIDSDFERTRRQRDVVEAAIAKMLNQPIASYPGIMQEVFPLLKTNMASGDMISIATDVVLNNIRSIEKMRFPTAQLGNGQMIRGQYYFVFDRPATLIQMGKYIYLDEK